MARGPTVLTKLDNPKSFEKQERPAAPAASPPISKLGGSQVRRLRVRDDRPVEENLDLSREGQGKRLLEARIKWHRTASDAARALGIAGPTYLAHENGTRQIRPDIAAFYARQFKISAEWLLFGAGESSIERESASVPVTAPSQPSGEIGGLARLLLALKVQPAADGTFVRQDTSGEPGVLPPISQTGGYVAELAHVHGDPSECLVALSEDSGQSPLALRDIWRIPTDMIERGRLFAVKLPSNQLLRDLPGGQRVYCDPDDLEVDDGGIFIVSYGSQGLVPMHVSRAGQRDELRVTRSLARPPVVVGAAQIRLVGRVVMQLRPFGEADIHAVEELMMAKAGA